MQKKLADLLSRREVGEKCRYNELLIRGSHYWSIHAKLYSSH